MPIEAKIEDIEIEQEYDGSVEMWCNYYERKNSDGLIPARCDFTAQLDAGNLNLGVLADPKLWSHRHYAKSPFGQQSDRFLK